MKRYFKIKLLKAMIEWEFWSLKYFMRRARVKILNNDADTIQHCVDKALKRSDRMIEYLKLLGEEVK